MAFTDDFDGEGTDANLEDHTPSGGTAWSLISGGAGSAKCTTAGEVEGNSSGDAEYNCDDQADADHYAIHRSKLLGSSLPDSFVACRLADTNNFIGWRLFGSGAAGRRLSKRVSGTITDLITSQGVDKEWIKVEVEGSTARLYEGGTGASPSWTQVSTDQTFSDDTTTTTQGLMISNVYGAAGWIDDFEAGVLGGGGGATGKCNPLHGPLGGPLYGAIA